MTQPDESQPDGAISGTGLAAFANKSQADWEAEQRNSMSTAWAGAEVGFQKIVGEIPVIGDIVEILTGKEDGNLEDLGTWVNGITSGLRRALNDIGTIIAGIGGTIARDVGNFVNGIWTSLTDTWNDFWGGVFGTSRTTGKRPADVRTAANALSVSTSAAAATASTAANGVVDTSRAIYNGYFGGGAAGTVAQVQETVAAIKTKLESGYTLETLTESGTWTRPWTTGGTDEPSEFWALCFGSGGGGGAGQYATSGTVVGGNPGQAGAYAAIQIEVADIPATVSYTVATSPAGQSGATRQTVAGGTPTAGSQTSFGSFIETIAGRAFVSSLFGYYDADDSSPGVGGVGGGVLTPQPTAGTATPLATAGTAGSNPDYTDLTLPYTNSVAGGTGGTASLTGTTRAGGGGGGGGGAGRTITNVGVEWQATNGGNGGFPGGSGGGGGAMRNERNLAGYNPGSGGAGGAGVIILLWK